MAESVLRVGLVYPSVLGTYGDSGNALILVERATRRGIPAELVVIDNDDAVPVDLDIYSLGGGEDTAQAIAAERLRKNPGLSQAAAKGAQILAICASLQVLGNSYTDATGRTVDGLGLLDVTTAPRGSRAIGELVTEPLLSGLTQLLTGFENHGGGTTLGPDATPLGRVLAGVGNGPVGEEPLYEGAVQGSVIGTYLHGPVLARNPQLADYLLERVVGSELSELEIDGVGQLRKERLEAAGIVI